MVSVGSKNRVWWDAQDRFVRLKGHQKNPQDREHEEQDDRSDGDAAQDALKGAGGLHPLMVLYAPPCVLFRAGGASS